MNQKKDIMVEHDDKDFVVRAISKSEEESVPTLDLEETTPEPVAPPTDSAMSVIEEAADNGDPVASDKGFETQFEITKSTAERLANRLNAIPKGEGVDLKDLVETVCSQVEELHREKARRSQQNRRTIASLRASDPKGKKTCGRCGFRTPLDRMDSKKELCEICSS